MTEPKTIAAKALDDGDRTVETLVETDVAPRDMFVVDLGRQSRKKLKRLRRGKGSLMDDVAEAVRELRDAGEISGAATPIIFIASAKEKTREASWLG